MARRLIIRIDGREYVQSGAGSHEELAKYLTTNAGKAWWLSCDDGRYVVLTRAHIERAEIIVEEVGDEAE